ncbi:MAG TPA: class I SAM-dependent methyltransferase [Thermoleophilaceae bacterium]|jgi:SAM-dependent methyltransferase
MSVLSRARGALRHLTPLRNLNRVPVPAPIARRLKHPAESAFWRVELERIARWYDGQEHRGHPPPEPHERVTGHDRRTDAALTYARVFHDGYARGLRLHRHALRGMRVLDVGCGPFPSLLAFEGCEPHGLDPLVDRYRAAGFPLAEWEGQGYAYHRGRAEAMPFADASFDAVVSMNAIDHLDDFVAAAREVRRVLRHGGLLRILANYHERTLTEPFELSDAAFLEHYGWLDGLERLAETSRAGAPGGVDVLWGNRPELGR